MADFSVSFALESLFSFLSGQANHIAGVHREFEDIKNELQSIQAFLKDAETRAAAETGNEEGIRTWMKQLRDVTFRIEVLIDEYKAHVAKRRQPLRPRCTALFHVIARLFKTLMSSHRIATEIQDVKSTIQGIKQRSESYGFRNSLETRSVLNTSRQTRDNWRDPRIASLYIEEAEVVGFDSPRDQLVGLLLEGKMERAVIAVVGTGGLGKTTLSKTTFDNSKVRGHFECHAWITVSQSYTTEGLLRSMIEEFCKSTKSDPPQGIGEMNEQLLIDELRQSWMQKRYIICFDDVWNENFWDEIKLGLLNNNNGSRIIITTRNLGVAKFCDISAFVHVHKLQPLPRDKAFELFCKKAFQPDCDDSCPEELKDIANEIVEKCEGLPLAIVTVGGLLSRKGKERLEWQTLLRNLHSDLLSVGGLARILSLSYDDLPFNLKPCFLYFGIYPKGYSINCARLTRQWIAEEFVKCEKRCQQTLEEIAEQYLTELINRGLVQVTDYNFDGKARKCQVHDLFREMIMKKIEDSDFCCFVKESDPSFSDGKTRRLAISTDSCDSLWRKENSFLRSLFVVKVENFPKSFVSRVPAEFKHLRVMDFEEAPVPRVPDNLGKLFHLKYLSLRNTNLEILPKSIGMLQNLETLDLKGTLVQMIPRQINNLTMLRHLLAYNRRGLSNETYLNCKKGVQMEGGVGCLVSLQKLYQVDVNLGGAELIKELRKLRQLRKLGLKNVKREHGEALCASLNEMKHLATLDITATEEDEVIDLNFISSARPELVRLHLKGRLEKFPEWVPGLLCLARLTLAYSKLTDPLVSLMNLPNLLDLRIIFDAFHGEKLCFQEGGFRKLKELRLGRLTGVNSILIEKGALVDLEHFEIVEIPQLEEVSGVHYLENLKYFLLVGLPDKFIRSIDPTGEQYWVIKHVPFVYVCQKVGHNNDKYETHRIHHPSSNT